MAANLDLLSFKAFDKEGFVKIEVKFNIAFIKSNIDTIKATTIAFSISENKNGIISEKTITLENMEIDGIYTLVYYDYKPFLSNYNTIYKLKFASSTSTLNISNSAGVNEVEGENATFQISHYWICEDLFLITPAHKLLLYFNPSLTNYSFVKNEAFIQTLGSRFPFYMRNGVVNYKQFSLGGLLSYHLEDNTDELDETRNFLSKEEKSKFDIEYKLDSYNQELCCEKLFRDKVIDFLTNDQNKLLCSPTESPVIVQLSKVTLTPQQQLGRIIYSFSAQATEVEEATDENMIKYSPANIRFHIALYNSEGEQLIYA